MKPPKEKAKELVDNFYQLIKGINYSWTSEMMMNEAGYAAIILVDQNIELCTSQQKHCTKHGGIDGLKWISDELSPKYWHKVKLELKSNL